MKKAHPWFQSKIYFIVQYICRWKAIQGGVRKSGKVLKEENGNVAKDNSGWDKCWFVIILIYTQLMEEY